MITKKLYNTYTISPISHFTAHYPINLGNGREIRPER